MATVGEATATFVRNIEKSTGRSLADWVGLARGSGLTKHGGIMGWLKSEHGLSHAHANFLAKEALKVDGATGDDLVAAQFAGAKAALKPLYDRLASVIRRLGTDVELAPKKNNVSVRRRRQFALLQPSTATRLDLGLILRDVQPAGRLEASGRFNAMFTHRVRIATMDDIDDELAAWLGQAYREA